MTSLAGRALYLDANVFIYAVEKVEPYASALVGLVSRIADGTQQAVTSEVSLAEALVLPLREGDGRRRRAFEQAIRSRGGLAVVPVSRAVLIEAARLRATLRLKLPDAIHAATARLHGCDVLLTNDAGIGAVPGVEVIRLSRVA